MKSILVTGVLFLAASVISAGEEAKSKPPVVSGRPTHADLVKRQAELKKAEVKDGGGKEVSPIGTTKKRGILVCLLYTSPSPRDQRGSRMPSSA